jgi:hypothetical protein
MKSDKMGKNERNNGTNSTGNNSGIPQSTQTHTSKYQNDDQKPSKKVFCIKSLINLLIYTTCILSLSISLYLSYRHHELEINVKSLMYLEHKVMRLESDLDELRQKTNRMVINPNRDSIIGVDDDAASSSSNDDDSSYANKLPPHVFGEITRLKRDVSNLKMARQRQQRQTGAQSPNENCLCPPGESLKIVL